MKQFLGIPVFFGLSFEVYLILFIIAVPTFFFWRWLLKKHILEETKRKISTWIATLLLTPLIYVGLISVLIFGLSYEPSRDFNKSKWLEDKNERHQMANDIIKSKMLIGKDTNQLKQILGSPTWQTATTQQWTYDMGTGGGGLGFMFHNLIIRFEKEKVVSIDHAKTQD